MPVPSLVDNLKILEADLVAQPIRIAAHSDMPFAIFRYAPSDEFTLRRQLRLLAISMEQKHRKHVTFISLSRLVWDVIRKQEGVEYLFKTEVLRGFRAAQEHINHLLTSKDFQPAPDALMEIMENLKPESNVVFLIRAGGFAPFIYRCSLLLDGLHRRTMVPSILFYPGSAAVGTDLRFFDLPVQGTPGVYNYRVKVYGVES